MPELQPKFELPAIWQPTERWIRTSFNGETVANSKQVMLMIENDREMAYYFPLPDLQEGYLRPSVPRTAFSHSASVGSRRPAHRQYAWASSQDTNTTG